MMFVSRWLPSSYCPMVCPALKACWRDLPALIFDWDYLKVFYIMSILLPSISPSIILNAEFYLLFALSSC
jgi:hypothetical protein